MPHTSALSVVRPDVASLGYGLFIATNATCMWGGLFPFLPPEIRDGGFMFVFYLVISLVSAVMVTPAQPLVGMFWLMVSIFAPELAKIDR